MAAKHVDHPSPCPSTPRNSPACPGAPCKASRPWGAPTDIRLLAGLRQEHRGHGPLLRVSGRVRACASGIAPMGRSYGDRGAEPFDMPASAVNPVGLQVLDFTHT